MLAALAVAACHREVARAPSTRSNDDVVAATCAGRDHCRVERTQALGDASAEPRELVTVWLEASVCPECEPCPEVEYWLVTHRPLRARLLVAAGLACMQWSDRGAELRADALVYTYAGSGAPISGIEPVVTTIALFPLGVRSQTVGGRAVPVPSIPANLREPIVDCREDND